MEARDNFFREAYKKNEEERSNWEREVAEQYQEMYETDVFDEFIEKAMEFEIKHSNSLILDGIINTYMEKENNDILKMKVRKCWVGSWDSVNFNNALVQVIPYYDASHLIRITTELQIALRRVSELFAIALYTYIAKNHKSSEFSIELAAKLCALQLRDIIDDTDNYVTEGFPLISDNFKNTYDVAFRTAYISGLSFVLFHEIGHIFEVEDDLAAIYSITPSYLCKDKTKRRLQAEWNADVIGVSSVKKLYCDIEETKWMAVSGVLMAFVTLALTSKNVIVDTDHPALSKRFKKAKQEMYTWLDENEKKLVDFHIETICILLQSSNLWQEINWWMSE